MDDVDGDQPLARKRLRDAQHQMTDYTEKDPQASGPNAWTR
jgi:hypothetical protein